MLMAMALALSACNPPTPDPTPTPEPVGEGPTITFDVSNTSIQVSENAVTSADTDGSGDLEFTATPAAGMSVLWYSSLDANGNRLTINDEGNNTYSIVGATVDAEVYFISWPKTPVGDPEVDSAFGGGSGVSGDPYIISSADHLQQLAADVFGTSGEMRYANFYTGKYFRIEGNFTELDISGFEWLPIGGGAGPRSFQGIFDGNGKTITGITYAHDGGEYSKGSNIKNNIGLFGKVEVDASVSNLTITSGSIAAQRAVGGIVGTSWGTIDNCVNSSVLVSSTESQGVGGIAGASRINGEEDPPSTPVVSNCRNEAAITSTLPGNPTPGPDESQGGSAGGIIGENEGLVYNSWNTGAINAKWNAGGIVGANQNNEQQESAVTVTLGLIANSYNAGTVTSVYYAGGIVGYQFASAENVYNHGAVSGDFAGEIIGQLAPDPNTPTIVNDYLYYRTGTTAVGQYDDPDDYTAIEYDPSGDDPDLPDMGELLTSLNAWVTNNQTTPPTYKSWVLDTTGVINDGYPYFS
jgi:hypothetical protein